MSELQAYYDGFRQGWWADPDPDRCLCHGSGWALSDVDTWHQCPIHYKGQLDPEDYHEDETPEQWQQRNAISIARHTKQVDPALVEAGVQLPTGELACGYCGGFGHPHGRCPPTCPECGDGFNFPSSECRRCREEIARDMNEVYGEVKPDIFPPGEDEIPF
jgi:hypothetical protein